MIHSTTSFTNAAIDSRQEVLQDIHLATKSIAIFQRSITPLATELASVATKNLECRANGSAAVVSSEVRDFFTRYLPDCPLLLDDVIELLELFRKTTQASAFRLLFSTVRTDMCRKFHTDINDLRLLCTYAGPGTHWLPSTAIIQETNQPRMAGNQELAVDLRQIQRAATGAVLLLKGALYPDANPIVHRSPPIEDSTEKRLLLRIDTNESLNHWT